MLVIAPVLQGLNIGIMIVIYQSVWTLSFYKDMLNKDVIIPSILFVFFQYIRIHLFGPGVSNVVPSPPAPIENTVVTRLTTLMSLFQSQHQGAVVPLGRVYVQDPDDWDAEGKNYSWRNPQAGFFLDSSTGHLAMAPSIPDGQ